MSAIEAISLRTTRICRAILAILACWIGISTTADSTSFPLKPVEAASGMVASSHVLASEAGAQILKKGGNAVDAAVATGFALAAVYPFAGNLGGGGFMMVHLANGTNVFIDYRETAPVSASKDMYLGPDGNPLPATNIESSLLGYRASGVPGTVAGLYHAWTNYGSHRVSWRDVIEPARRLAAGHRISKGTIDSLRANAAVFSPFDESKRIYLNSGQYWNAGDTWRQPELAATFARLQTNGPREFYELETARLIADDMTRHRGSITLEDLKNYRVVERTPLYGNYRGYTVVTAPPPSSGFALLQMLKMIEPFPIQANGANSATNTHFFVEAMRRAFRDRAAYLSDPGPPFAASGYLKVPVEGLLDPNYITGRMSDLTALATPSSTVQPGKPAGWEEAPWNNSVSRESHETTHFSVVDANGCAVANTYTLNGPYGSGVTIAKTGILMNNEMDDFYIGEKGPGYKAAQAHSDPIVRGRRPVSSMIPTLVFRPDGQLYLVTGSPGGRTIINTVFQVLVNTLDYGMNIKQAVEAPRIDHQWLPDRVAYEHDRTMPGLSPETIAQLKSMGYLDLAPYPTGGSQGDAESIMVDPKTGHRLGAADSRSADSGVVGY